MDNPEMGYPVKNVPTATTTNARGSDLLPVKVSEASSTPSNRLLLSPTSSRQERSLRMVMRTVPMCSRPTNSLKDSKVATCK
jgi:hypothetical protein